MAKGAAWFAMGGIRGHGGDAGAGFAFSRRPDDLQPDLDVRAWLGTVRRNLHLLLGCSDAQSRTDPALA